MDLVKVDSLGLNDLRNIYNLIKNERVLKDAIFLSLFFCQIFLSVIHKTVLTSLVPYVQNSIRVPYDSACLKNRLCSLSHGKT